VLLPSCCNKYLSCCCWVWSSWLTDAFTFSDRLFYTLDRGSAVCAKLPTHCWVTWRWTELDYKQQRFELLERSTYITYVRTLIESERESIILQNLRVSIVRWWTSVKFSLVAFYSKQIWSFVNYVKTGWLTL